MSYPAYSGLALHRLPDIRAEPIGPLNGFEIQRVTAGVRDIDIVQRDPEQAGREFLHQLAGDEDGEFIGACQAFGMCGEVGNGQLQDVSDLMQGQAVTGEFRSIQGRFVVVPKKVLIET